MARRSAVAEAAAAPALDFNRDAAPPDEADPREALVRLVHRERPGGRSSREETSMSRGAYRTKAEARIEEYQARLDGARAKLKGASADARLDLEKQIGRLEKQIGAARKKAADLADAADETLVRGDREAGAVERRWRCPSVTTSRNSC